MEGFPLSPQQRRLWAVQPPGPPGWWAEAEVRVTGPLDAWRLGAAVEAVVARHEILRTTFRRPAGIAVPVQVVAEHLAPDISFHRLDGDGEDELERLRQVAAARADLAAGPLLALALAALADGEHRLFLRLPAAWADARSLENLVEEIAGAYAAGPAAPAGPPLQYADLAEVFNGLLDGEESEAGAEHWAGLDLAAALVQRLPFESAGGERAPLVAVSAVLPAAGLAAAVELAARLGASLESVLLAAWQTLVFRLGGLARPLIGVALDGRGYEGLEGALGLFARFLPVRCEIAAELPFSAVVEQASAALSEAADWQDSFAWERAVGPAAGGDAPFLPWAFELRRRRSPVRAGEAVFTLLRHEVTIDRCGLLLSCREEDDGLRVVVRCEPGRWRPQDARLLAERFCAVVPALAAAPAAPVGEVDVLAPAERRDLLARNLTAAEFPAACLHQLFAAQCRATPGRPALRQGDRVWTYGDLDRWSGRLAAELVPYGVGPEVVAAICLEPSPEAVAAVLAVLRAGGAFLPLDPGHPRERLAGLLSDAAAAVVLTAERWRQALPAGGPPVLFLDGAPTPAVAATAAVAAVTAFAEAAVSPRQMAYVLYTSGSSGRPKGVMVEHRSLVNYLTWVNERLLGAGTVLPAITRLSFDAGLKQLLAPLVRGGEVWLLPPADAADPARLLDALASRPEAALNCVPALWRAVLQAAEERGAGARGPAMLLLGGERLDEPLLARTLAAFPGLAVWNLYGPTEVTANAAAGRLAAAGPISIGGPIANARLYLLDERQRLVPPGCPGEICVGGAGVARGYLGRPDQTAERFLPDPWGGAGERLYRTGDLARALPAGGCEFLGRADHQVKVRGFRVELGEIEALLREHPAVADAAVVLRSPDDGAGGRLVGYVEVRAGAPLAIAALRAFLAGRAPDFMVPASLVVLRDLPRTPGGKVDRAALPAAGAPLGGRGRRGGIGGIGAGGDPGDPRAAGAAGDACDPGDAENLDDPNDPNDPSEAPRSPAERALAGLWRDLLGVAEVGIHDNFFRLGGHSLLAIQLLSRLRAQFAADLPLRAVLDAPDLASLARQVEGAAAAAPAPPLRPAPRDGGAFPLSFAQERLWFFAQLEPASPRYNLPAALRLRGTLDHGALRRGLDEIRRRHEVLRTRYPTVAGRPTPTVDPPAPFPLPLVDLAAVAAPRREAELARLLGAEARRPFDLGSGPLLRRGLLRLEARDHALFLTLHHIVSDGWSTGVLVDELRQLYAGFAGGRPAAMAELPVQYADYARWERDWLQGEVLAAKVEPWRQRLAGMTETSLPTDRPRGSVESARGAVLVREQPAAAAAALRELARQEGATLFIVLLAAFKVLLHHATGRHDIAVGTDVANRSLPELEPLVGFFTNQLVLRTDLAGNPSFRQVVTRVRETTLDAFSRQDVPFHKLVPVLRPERDLSRNPLFQIMFSLQNAPRPALALPGLEVTPIRVETGSSVFDLSLYMTERAESLHAALRYNADLFAAETMTRLLDRYAALLAHLAARPAASLDELAAFLAEEGRQESLASAAELEKITAGKLSRVRSPRVRPLQAADEAAFQTAGEAGASGSRTVPPAAPEESRMREDVRCKS
jgi:pristinamycin I synthase-3/4